MTGPRLLVRAGRRSQRPAQAAAQARPDPLREVRRLDAGRQFSHRRRMAVPGRAGSAAAAEPAVSLGERRLRDVRRFPGRPVVGTPQDHPARAARRPGQASRSQALTGVDLREEHWDAFFAFYMDTGARKWGRPYLNRRSFRCSASGWPTGCCWSWPVAAAAGSPARST